ncbi:MAG: hypothetical protein E7291_00895 [Lachnospiraceae bacterium]|nr:hypothetical protein [Lachnospiraceae bacterium]
MKEESKKKNFIRRPWQKVFLFLTLLVLILGCGSYVYAKYYAESARRGIAIASGIYFSANYAVESKENEAYFESVVKSIYTGSAYSFNFEVRNYENNLLFNGSDIEIPYTVSFWLDTEPEGATYSVGTEKQAAQPIGVGEAGWIVFDDQVIAGGVAKANKYEISINITDEDSEQEPLPIYVLVETEPGAVITKTLSGKMILGRVAASESFIESQRFVVANESDSMTEEEKYAEINKLSKLTYEILTVGEVSASEEATEKLKLSWNPQVLEIDLFDEAYLNWLDEDADRIQPIEDEKGWYYITINAMPYSAETIGFFKGSAYADNVTNLESLHSFIKAEKYTES